MNFPAEVICPLSADGQLDPETPPPGIHHSRMNISNRILNGPQRPVRVTRSRVSSHYYKEALCHDPQR